MYRERTLEKVDGIAIDKNLTFIRIGDKEVKSGDISLSSPLTFNKTIG